MVAARAYPRLIRDTSAPGMEVFTGEGRIKRSYVLPRVGICSCGSRATRLAFHPFRIARMQQLTISTQCERVVPIPLFPRVRAIFLCACHALFYSRLVHSRFRSFFATSHALFYSRLVHSPFSFIFCCFLWDRRDHRVHLLRDLRRERGVRIAAVSGEHGLRH